MRILFLDDMAVRHQAFDDYAEGHDVQHVWTAPDAIRALMHSGNSFDAACLDHDLEEEHYQNLEGYQESRGRSGRAVARWIAEHKTPPYVLVHSFNSVGAFAICEILRGSGVRVHKAPFGPKSCRDWVASVASRLPPAGEPPQEGGRGR